MKPNENIKDLTERIVELVAEKIVCEVNTGEFTENVCDKVSEKLWDETRKKLYSRIEDSVAACTNALITHFLETDYEKRLFEESNET